MHKQLKILIVTILILGVLTLGVYKLSTVNAVNNEDSSPQLMLQEANFQGTEPIENLQLNEDVPVDIEKVAPLVEFMNIEYSLTSRGFNFKGKLYSENVDVDGLIVKLFCNGNESVNKLVNINELTFSDKDGNFEMISNCSPNDEAYAQLQYGEVTFESMHVIVPHGRFGHRSANTASITSSPAGVPEYSTLTIGFAVITALFGLVFLKKKINLKGGLK